MDDKEGARVQLDLLLSGKPVEVNAAGRQVHAVYSSQPTQRDHLDFMDTPCTGQVQSRSMSSCQIPPLSVLVLTDRSFQERTAPVLVLSSHGNGILISLPQNASHSQIQYTLFQDALAHVPQPQSCTSAHLF
jgi:hypothetical protein